LEEEDRVGVIGFFERAQLLQPLTEDRDEFAAALRRAALRIGVTVGGPDRTQLNSNFRVDRLRVWETASFRRVGIR
jgi:hypothetical protein